MEPADNLPQKPVLDDTELKGEPVILEHHSMLTPSSFGFSVLRNPSQNFQFRGVLWLTEHRLLYKGFFIKKMGASKVSDKLMKPFCDVDVEQPFAVTIPIENIADIYMGHDNIFQKRFQRYPKLRIQFKMGDGVQIYYFYLTRENLIDDELYINKRCQEWREKITEVKNKLAGVKPTPSAPAVPSAPTVPAAPTAKAGAPAVTLAPKALGIGTEGILKEAMADAEGKRYGKIVVKPIEEREKPKFTALAKPVQQEEETVEPEFTKLLDTLVPVSDDEFQAAAADTSISKCPHCGWILGYATFKCPRCRKEI